MSKFVALMIEGERGVHARPAGGGNYATLCGQSGDDDPENGTIVPVKRGERINCRSCAAIIRLARQYTERNIASF